ncbi:Gar1/Naf1 RNA binding region-domain-containing protein [Coprinopsis sp. MPI-PUGE-AT-0042]|nr:Gar1/Naf1 RNA binding region-domain-containing protein [Coprinopsis sp. MPI-PUGE-AT-0042]
MAEFKLPGSVPQDLLLIQELIGPIEQPTVKVDAKQAVSETSDDISSSGSESEDGENDSEDEVVANLLMTGGDSEPASPKPASEPSDSSDSDSDSDSEPEASKDGKPVLDQAFDDGDDDEDPVGSTSAGGVLTTKHEVVEADITIPEIDEVAPEEQLEKVGEVMSIIDQIAIVRGLPSEQLNRAAQTALDSETLLVFDDRKVMGYIYETFGPTSQPLYQIKFNSKYPLQPERVQVGKAVFCVPARSKFVFVDRIKAFKGSDASNVYDEEPADDELEFSDDEAEAAFRSRLKRKRAESRQRSSAPSRDPTPNPSHLRDQQLADLGQSAYSEHGPYDVGYAEPGPSRPRPSAYDDPYANPYDADVPTGEPEPRQPAPSPPQNNLTEQRQFDSHRPQHARGRGRGRGRGQQPHRGRGGIHRPDQGRSPSYGVQQQQYQQPWLQQGHGYGEGAHQEYNPQTSLPGAQNVYGGQNMQPPGMGMEGGWGYPSAMPMNYNFNPTAFQQQGMGMRPFVQPHINPRFAPAFGFNPVGQQQGNLRPQQYPSGNANAGNPHQQWPAQ